MVSKQQLEPDAGKTDDQGVWCSVSAAKLLVQPWTPRRNVTGNAILWNKKYSNCCEEACRREKKKGQMHPSNGNSTILALPMHGVVECVVADIQRPREVKAPPFYARHFSSHTSLHNHPSSSTSNKTLRIVTN